MISDGGEAHITFTTPYNSNTYPLLLSLKEGPKLFIDFEQPQAFMPDETKTIPFRILPEGNTDTDITYTVSDVPEGWKVNIDGREKTISITAPMVSDGGEAIITLNNGMSTRPLSLYLKDGLKLSVEFEQPATFLPNEMKTVRYTLESDYSNVAVSAIDIPTGWQVNIDQNKKEISITAPDCFDSNNVTAQIVASIDGKTDAKNLNLQADAHYSDEGVEINSVKWATRNVDMPGTFAAAPESAGMFYQWNRNVGWSATDPLINSNGGTVWDNSLLTGNDWSPTDIIWEPANDPSPCGWRVPSPDDIEKLLDANKVTQEWAVQNGVEGIKFTDKVTNSSIFLPAAKGRNGGDGMISWPDFRYGNYWSSMRNAGYSNVITLSLGNNITTNEYYGIGQSLRPVKE